MSELVRWQTEHGPVVVEVGDRDPGFRSVSRADGVVYEAQVRFEDAMRNVRSAAESALATLRDGALKPDAVELEFGVKLNVAAGAVIAKTSVEGQLKVKLTWGAAPAGEPEQEQE
ncbi:MULTISPECIES: CU044_2847 family protein [Thermomonosporaceae]|uniref:CU044_2847 family protein n=1 Tax=Thermomonosporaceae TaxID=2012 RepID=UPI00255ABCBF|nr:MULTISPECIES: CU044_2847 family protein [Thermomonosporaceae]MDL4772162.1 CU044_2847 family protein [Actinomadura xylanilytica]